MSENARLTGEAGKLSQAFHLNDPQEDLANVLEKAIYRDNTIYCCKIALTYNNVFPYSSPIRK